MHKSLLAGIVCMVGSVVYSQDQLTVAIGSVSGPVCTKQTWEKKGVSIVKTKVSRVVRSTSKIELSTRVTADRAIAAESMEPLKSCTSKAATTIGTETISSRPYESADVLRSLINKCLTRQNLSLQVIGTEVTSNQVCQ